MTSSSDATSPRLRVQDLWEGKMSPEVQARWRELSAHIEGESESPLSISQSPSPARER